MLEHSKESNSLAVELTMRRDRLAWLKFMVESYENLALVSTLPGRRGRVRFLVSAGQAHELKELLAALATALGLARTWEKRFDEQINTLREKDTA